MLGRGCQGVRVQRGTSPAFHSSPSCISHPRSKTGASPGPGLSQHRQRGSPCSISRALRGGTDVSRTWHRLHRICTVRCQQLDPDRLGSNSFTASKQPSSAPVCCPVLAGEAAHSLAGHSGALLPSPRASLQDKELSLPCAGVSACEAGAAPTPHVHLDTSRKMLCSAAHLCSPPTHQAAFRDQRVPPRSSPPPSTLSAAPSPCALRAAGGCGCGGGGSDDSGDNKADQKEERSSKRTWRGGSCVLRASTRTP